MSSTHRCATSLDGAVPIPGGFGGDPGAIGQRFGRPGILGTLAGHAVGIGRLGKPCGKANGGAVVAWGAGFAAGGTAGGADGAPGGVMPGIGNGNIAPNGFG